MNMQAVRARYDVASEEDIEAAIAFVDYSRWTHEPMVPGEYAKWTERQQEAWHLAELQIEGNCHQQAILEYDHVLAVLAGLPAALEALEEARRLLTEWCRGHNARGSDGPCDCNACRFLGESE